MRGCRVKFRVGRKMFKMTSFGTMNILMVFCMFYSLCFAEKEFINKGNLWDNESSSGGNEDGIGWSGNGNTKFVCAIKNDAKLPMKYINLADARRVFVEIDYKLTKKFSKSGGFFLLSNLMVSENSSETKNDDKLVVNKHRVSNAETKNQTKATLHYDLSEDDHFMNLTLYAVGACVQVFKIRIYYYVCPTNETLMVTRTAAPSTGFLEASANCSIKQSGKKGSVVVAKCGSDGEWSKVEDKEGGCTNDCGAGTELINDTCTVCEENYFKKDRGTHACIPCPKNTVSEKSGASCKCKERHYSENGLCKAIPSRPKNLRYTRLPFNTIQLHWNMSKNDTVVHPDLHFSVTCKEYYEISGDWENCRNLSLGERGMNVTTSPLEIGRLMNNTNYTFSVAAFNNVSVHIKEEWNVATIDVYVAWNAVPAIHAPTDVGSANIKPVTSKESTSAIPNRNTPEVTREATPPTVRPSTTLFSTYGQEGKTSAQESSNSQLAPYIGIAIGAILFILVLIAIVIYRRRKRIKKKTLIDNEEGYSMNTSPQAYVDPHKYGNPEKAVRKFAKEIDRREIKLEGLIGEGEFAKVHKGMLCRPNEPPVPVALKVLKPGSTAKNREDFLTEAAVMGQFKDLNIVALEGVVTISHPVMIITEFMHNGALSDYLVQNKNRFSEIELLVMARGIASGMKYLAKMRFVHRDLAARNVLVNENLVCKVADFGLTRELEESCQGEYVTQGGKIPIRWTAPEAYKHRRFTTASDVWSFGIVLWEIMTYADRPYGDWDNYMVMDQVTANYRLFAPTNCPKIVHQLMMECWKADRSQRPSFSDIVEMLERWIRNPYLLKDYQYVTEKDRMADRKSCVAKSIRDYLEAIKMDRYIDNFIDFGYTELYQIQHMTDSDLVGIGVPLIGHRNKIIKSLRGERELLLPVDV